MPEEGSEKISTSEFFKQRSEMHRAYVSRQWQYYASYIVLNGLFLSSINNFLLPKVGASPFEVWNFPLINLLVIAFLFTSSIFFHLILWTGMRTSRNVQQLNKLSRDSLGYNFVDRIEEPFGGIDFRNFD